MTTETPPEIIDEVPIHIIKAAKLIENWMKEQGSERWELMGLCSRNHADDAKNFKHLYEQQSKANLWQSEVIKLAEEYDLPGEYLDRKWKIVA